MKRYYNIIETNICIQGNEEQMYTDEYRLEPFQSGSDESDVSYSFSVVDELDECRGECVYNSPGHRVYHDGKVRIHYIGSVAKDVKNAYIRCESVGNYTKVQVKRSELPDRITSKVVLNAMGIEALALRAQAFILHASYIEVDGKAILFTAPSGTGKSTQAELWSKLRRANIINGDRAAIQINENGVQVYGIPFAGSSEYCKKARLPLSAIIYLAQAPETSIEPMRGREAFVKLWEEITIPVWEEKATEQISGMILQLLAQVPVYKLACTPDESAVLAVEHVINKNHGKEE